jgi:hypothetical protein
MSRSRMLELGRVVLILNKLQPFVPAIVFEKFMA